MVLNRGTAEPAFEAEPRWLNVEQVAKRLSVRPRTVWDWVKKGKWPRPVKIGKHSRWDAADVAAIVRGIKRGVQWSPPATVAAAV